jgi:hypothetical protein
VLISKGLKIICKVSGEIYTPGGYRGGRGGTKSREQGIGNREQGIEKYERLWKLFID